MIPHKNNQFIKDVRYLLLEYDDIIKDGDEYYNNCLDEWLPVNKEFIGDQFRPDESKPVRRFNKLFKIEEELKK